MVPDRFAPVLAELGPLAQRFEAAGHRLYLVGGTVRDLLVDSGRDDFDLDLTTDARPDEIKACLGPRAESIGTHGERLGPIRAKTGRRPNEKTTIRAAI
jgi:poly(A) polymerase